MSTRGNKAPFVLLCYGRNTPYAYDAATPLSILCLGTFLETRGVTVEYFDERIDPQRRFSDLAARKPALVGFSVIGGYQISSSARLSRIMRQISPETLVAWGGICPTTLTEQCVREDFVDLAVVGEGEETLLELVEALGRGDDPRQVPGVASWGEGGLQRAPTRALPDLESLPFVYQGQAEHMLRRYMGRRSLRESVGYEVSRGCPFECAFCYSPGFHSKARVKSPAKVAQELDELRRLGVDDLDIYDDTLFGGRQADFSPYLTLLGDRGFTWIGNLRINMLDDDLLRELEAAGCKWLYFGIESDDDATLARIRKGVSAAEIAAGVETMGRSDIPTVYSIIYGLPLEGEKDRITRYLDLAERLHVLDPEAEVQIQSYVPLPGSELFEDALRLGFEPPTRLLDWVSHDHFSVRNPWLDEPDLASKVYLASFLAFRYRRHLSHLPVSLLAYPLHRLSLWRIRTRRFGFFFERGLYRMALASAEFVTRLRFMALNLRARW